MEYKLELVLVPVTDVDRAKETLLRAWRGRDGFDGSGLFGAWLYRIASDVCLDTLRRSSHRAAVLRSFAEVPWLRPYRDRLLPEAAAPAGQPDAAAIDRETIEPAFVAALQVLPPRQRATLTARDVLERAFGPEREGDWRLVPAAANRMPAAASYLRRPGASVYRPFKIDVLRVDGGLIREITTFGAGLFPVFGLPPTMS